MNKIEAMESAVIDEIKEREEEGKKMPTICRECKHCNTKEFIDNPRYWNCFIGPYVDFATGDKHFWFCQTKNKGNCLDFEAREDVK